MFRRKHGEPGAVTFTTTEITILVMAATKIDVELLADTPDGNRIKSVLYKARSVVDQVPDCNELRVRSFEIVEG